MLSTLPPNQVAEELTEIELSPHCKTLGSVHKIDPEEDEVWLLQCPRGMKLDELEQEQLKLPGRTSLRGQEMVATEFLDGPRKEAFAYCRPKKQKYAVQILPVRGAIVVRERLQIHKDAQGSSASLEICGVAEDEYSGQEYINKLPNPSSIPIRHPLLGHRFEESLDRLKPSVQKRLVKADLRSAQMLKTTLKRITGKRNRKGSAAKRHKDRLLKIVKREVTCDSD